MSASEVGPSKRNSFGGLLLDIWRTFFDNFTQKREILKAYKNILKSNSVWEKGGPSSKKEHFWRTFFLERRTFGGLFLQGLLGPWRTGRHPDSML